MRRQPARDGADGQQQEPGHRLQLVHEHRTQHGPGQGHRAVRSRAPHDHRSGGLPRPAGTAADADPLARAAAVRPAASATPRRARRTRRSLRASASRPETVPSFQSSSRAASPLLRPWRQHITNGARSFAGRRDTSSSRIACTSRSAASAGGPGGASRPSGRARARAPLLAPRPQRHAVGDAVQPGGDRVTLADRRGLAGEDEERGLEGVLGVLLLTQHVAADAPNKPAVALQQGSEGRLLGAPRRSAPGVGCRSAPRQGRSDDVGDARRPRAVPRPWLLLQGEVFATIVPRGGRRVENLRNDLPTSVRWSCRLEP